MSKQFFPRCFHSRRDPKSIAFLGLFVKHALNLKTFSNTKGFSTPYPTHSSNQKL
jgi:hypothetical protein